MSTDLYPWLACLAAAVASAIAFDSLANSKHADAPSADGGEQIRARRRQQVAEANSYFRRFGKIVDEIGGWVGRGMTQKSRDELAKDFARAAEKTPWSAEEFLGVGIVEAILVSIALGALLAPMLGAQFGIIVALILGASFVPQKRRSLHKLASKRLELIRRRLPFAIDLISQMMQAGAGFGDALETIVREDPDHPLAVELATVCRQIEHGRSRSEALEAMAQRLDEETLNDFVFAVLRGEELGTPLTDVLTLQAKRLREKRSQWGEKAAGEAEVNLTFPVMVIMVACLLVVVAPLVLPPLLSF